MKMKGLKVYNIYLEEIDETVHKIPIPAETCEEALEEIAGNGRIVGKILDREFSIDTARLFRDLSEKGWKQSEIAVLVRLVERARLDKDSLPFE